MTTIRSFITAVLVLLACVEARAQSGDGICQAGSQEATSRQCAILGSNVLEIVPPGGEFPFTGTCHVNRRNHQPTAQICTGCHVFRD